MDLSSKTKRKPFHPQDTQDFFLNSIALAKKLKVHCGFKPIVSMSADSLYTVRCTVCGKQISGKDEKEIVRLWNK